MQSLRTVPDSENVVPDVTQKDSIISLVDPEAKEAHIIADGSEKSFSSPTESKGCARVSIEGWAWRKMKLERKKIVRSTARSKGHVTGSVPDCNGNLQTPLKSRKRGSTKSSN